MAGLLNQDLNILFRKYWIFKLMITSAIMKLFEFVKTENGEVVKSQFIES